MSELPRIVIDGRMVGPVPHGFARYITQLARGMEALRGVLVPSYEPVFLVGAETPAEAFGTFETVRVGAPFLNPLELLEIPSILRKLGARLYHSPTFSSLLSAPCPCISTVHDLNHLTYGGWKEKLYYRKLLKPFATRSAALVTVSEFSRSELAAWTGRGAQGIDIVYNSIDPALLYPMIEEEVAPVLARHGLEAGRYFFCLSNPKPHKNVGLLVEAYGDFRQASGADAALPLVLSMRGFGNAPGVRAIGGVGDAEVRALLSASRGVFFPSIYEGFGLPPVEAATVGAPLAVSRIAPHLEGLATLEPGEAHWVDPLDRAGWTRAFEMAARGELRPASTESRTKLVARFDSRAMAREMDRIYRRVLESGKRDPITF